MEILRSLILKHRKVNKIMSYSSLFLIDNNLKGHELYEFQNSWLFSPIIWNVLINEYQPERRQSFQLNPNEKRNYLSETMFDPSITDRLNDILNNSDNQADRIMWELSNQQAFFSKDKDFINESILLFISRPAFIKQDHGQHIFNRFREIAQIIKNIDTGKYPYFVFKNSSVDDGIESIFNRYNEEIEEYEEISLATYKERVLDFVVIENKKITGWENNLNLVNSREI